MDRATVRTRNAVTALQVGLAVFVVTWIFGPYELRAAVPVWIAFVIALTRTRARAGAPPSRLRRPRR